MHQYQTRCTTQPELARCGGDGRGGRVEPLQLLQRLPQVPPTAAQQSGARPQPVAQTEVQEEEELLQWG